MFQIACGSPHKGFWGMRPEDFWAMTPQEWWLVFDANIGKELGEKANTMQRLKNIFFEHQEAVNDGDS